MPSRESNELNKAIRAPFEAGEALSAVNARYRRRIGISDGVSLTGFDAAASISGVSVGVDNFIDVYLFDDAPFNFNQDIALLNYEPFLLFYLTQNIARTAGLISRTFDAPYQLRYGHEYVLLARVITTVAPVPPINITLTVYGFENTQKSNQVILR